MCGMWNLHIISSLQRNQNLKKGAPPPPSEKTLRAVFLSVKCYLKMLTKEVDWIFYGFLLPPPRS